nr:unnamed protein product [Naegleria fowleri]
MKKPLTCFLSFMMMMMILIVVLLDVLSAGKPSVLAAESSSSFFKNHQYTDAATPLDTYMALPDPYYSYTLASHIDNAAADVYILNMTSLGYLTPAQSNRPIWTHTLTLVVPKNLNTQIRRASLLVNGGDNLQPNIPSADLNDLILISSVTRTIMADLMQVPNQPIVFANDPLHMKRSEDDITAFTWRYFMNNTKQDADAYKWIIQLPMAKSAKYALDTMQSFTNDLFKVKQGENYIQDFIVMGGSKRGWTTFVLEHIYNSLCSFPIAMEAYLQQGIMTRLETPEFAQLASIIDPFVYRDRWANIDKFVVNGLGDIFFWPDIALYSYPYLPGGDENKRIRYVPNVGHSMAGSDIWETILTFIYANLYNLKLPVYTFDHIYNNNGAIVTVRILNQVMPVRVTLWQSTNPKARDFRITETGKSFTPSPVQSVTPDDPYTFMVFVPNPPQGWTAFSVEMEFGMIAGSIPLPPIKFTSAGYITPTTLPCKYPGSQ